MRRRTIRGGKEKEGKERKRERERRCETNETVGNRGNEEEKE